MKTLSIVAVSVLTVSAIAAAAYFLTGNAAEVAGDVTAETPAAATAEVAAESLQS